MKTIPLWQPWASLVAIGAKRIETRHWPAPDYLLGTRVAIHATKGTGPGGEKAFRSLCDSQFFYEALAEAGLTAETLPRGEVIATAVLAQTIPQTPERIGRLAANYPREYAFGEYSAGRHAWMLKHAIPLPRPVPFKGSQGIFDVPDSMLGFASPGQAQGTLL